MKTIFNTTANDIAWLNAAEEVVQTEHNNLTRKRLRAFVGMGSFLGVGAISMMTLLLTTPEKGGSATLFIERSENTLDALQYLATNDKAALASLFLMWGGTTIALAGSVASFLYGACLRIRPYNRTIERLHDIRARRDDIANNPWLEKYGGRPIDWSDALEEFQSAVRNYPKLERKIAQRFERNKTQPDRSPS